MAYGSLADPVWYKIAEAYNIVSKDPQREITLEMNGIKAMIYWSNFAEVVITITEIPNEKPVLIQP